MPYEPLFTREEFRRILGNVVKYCKAKLIKEGKLGKRGFSVDAKALHACVRETLRQIKQKRAQEKQAQYPAPELPL